MPRSAFTAAAVLVAMTISLSTSLAGADLRSQYEFVPVQIGGGGWVTGVAIHPTTPDVVYCRTDVGGAYRWNAATQHWTQLITADRMPASVMNAQGNQQEGAGVFRRSMYSVGSFALDPADANILYLAGGDDTSGDGPGGFILKSTNGGASFSHLTGAHIRIAGNGEGQGMERMQVDPQNSQVVYLGSRFDGLQRTLDGGTTWAKLTAPMGLVVEGTNYGISAVACDATSAKVSGRSGRVYAAVAKQGIYTTTDGGANWSKISGGAGKPPDTGVAFRMSAVGGTLYVAYGHFEGSGPGIWRYTPAGGWVAISPASNQPWEIAVDPNNNQRLFAASTWGVGSAWRSSNGGTSWTQLGTNSSPDGLTHFHSTIAPWKTVPGTSGYGWFSVGKFAFDPLVPGRMWFAEGFGMWRCNDFSDTVTTPNFYDISHGIEEMVCNQVLDLPGTKTLICTWDRPGFISTASSTYPSGSPFTTLFSDMSSAATCGGDRNIVAAIASDHGYLRQAPSAWSGNGGTTWTPFASTPEGSDPTPNDLRFGEIAISATNPDLLVWHPRNTDAKIYVSSNRGGSWATATTPGITGNTPYYASSTRVLAADRVIQRFGFYNWTTGNVLVSTNGSNWTMQTGTGLPEYCYTPIHVATPGQANHWWFASGWDYRAGDSMRGLYFSNNGGVSYSKSPGWDDAWSIGFGKAATGSSYPTIFAYGRRSAQFGLFRSTDAGSTWDLCVEYPLGLFEKISSVTGDMETFGRVHLGFAGNSAAEGRLLSAPANTAPQVNAGPDQAITLPGSANLDGTVSDDGLPGGSMISVTWSKVSGPGTVTFGNISAVDTTATFGAAGTYVLRLTATDSALSAFDNISITVATAPPTNTAPNVNAGPDQGITLPSSVNLDGTVSDDGLPGGSMFTVTWTKISGPGTVTFGNIDAVDTTAAFSVAGSYVLRLTASDSVLSASDNITVTVTAATLAPAITSQPANSTVAAGATANFTVAASGTPPPTIQWQRKISGTWTNLSGATNVTYSLTTVVGDNGAQFRAVATNTVGSATSNVVTLTVTPAGVSGTGTGLTGTYFNDTTLTNAVLTRTDAQVGFDWIEGSPAPGTVPIDGFSVRWAGTVQAQFTQTYTFFTMSDDGVRLWVNGQQLINNWNEHGPTEDSGTIALTAGVQYTITMEFFESSGGALAQLRWSSPATAKMLIPESQLYPAAVVLVAPAITSQPANAAVTTGASASYTVAVSGTPTPTVQWQRKVSGTWTNISGATNVTYGLTTVVGDNGAQFRAVATNSAGTATTNVATLTVTAAVPPGTVPAPWATGDIGSVGRTGSASSQGTVGSGLGITVTGGGADIWKSADAFQFVSQPMTGDGAIIARVVSQTNTNAWAKAGVMIRDGQAAGSRHAMLVATPSNGMAFQRRTTVNGNSTHTAASSHTAPRWVKLERLGSVITAYESTDGNTWTAVGSTTWSISATVRIGLAVTAHNNSALSTAVFDNVQIIQSGGNNG